MSLPDITGFQDAQRRLNEARGETVQVLTPQDPVWPDGTQLDRETGKPFDPLIEPVSGGGYDATEVDATVALQVDDSDVNEGQSGYRPDEAPIFIIMVEDYAAVANATRVAWNEAEYRITRFRPDSLRGVYRYMVLTEAT
jgi:hypothetical protein